MGHSAPTSVLTSLCCVIVSMLDAQASHPEVKTDKGIVRGFREHVHSKPIDIFYGIPFARKPVGRYRFRHPVSNDPWDNVYDATKKPNACMQAPDDMFGNFSGSQMWNPNTKTSEDCLYLNVWRPRITERNEKKAVMVWIYGGSYFSGSSSLDVYDAKYLVAEGDVIFVSMQYRVGSLGFLSFDISEAPGNAGVMDQVMALDWVQRNIHLFGGDTHNITIFGESSGSASVGMHLLSPLSRGKFHRAILQSGAPQAPWATYTPKEAKRRAYALAKNMNCTSDNPGDVLRCLRDAPAEKFTEVDFHMDIAQGLCQFPFVPMIDGTFLTESPESSFKRGIFKKTPILIGSNVNEGSWFLIYLFASNFKRTDESLISRRDFPVILDKMTDYFPQYPQQLSSIGKDAVLFQYTPWKDPYNGRYNRDSIEQMAGDLNFICPVVDLADAYAAMEQRVYYFEFAHRSSNHLWPEWMGVLHGDEINYVFGDPINRNKQYTHIERKLSRKMIQYWTNFAKTGDPNKMTDGTDLGEWPLHTKRDRRVLKLDAHLMKNIDKGDIQASYKLGPRSRHCAFWREYMPSLLAKTANMTELEIQWKVQFAEWSNKYIVDWKNQFDNFINFYERKLQECGSN